MPAFPRGAALDPLLSAPNPSRAPTSTCMVAAACIAPAPHHSRPWRWVVLDGEPARRDLALAMGERWRVDLEGDGVDPARIDRAGRRVGRNGCAPRRRRCSAVSPGTVSTATPTRLAAAPSTGCRCSRSGPRSRTSCSRRPIGATRRAGLPHRSSAPRPCGDALGLPTEWLPHALVLVGRPDPDYVGRQRPPLPLDDLRVYR